MALRSQLALVKRLWMSGWGRGGERLQLSPRACRVPALSEVPRTLLQTQTPEGPVPEDRG